MSKFSLKSFFRNERLLDRAYFFIIIIYSGMGAPALSQMSAFNSNYTFYFALPLLFTLYFLNVNKEKIHFKINYFLALLVIIIWSIIQAFKIGYVSGAFFMLIYQLSVSYILVVYYKEKLFLYY